MVIGRPAILVPLPHALDDNQTPNADVLERSRRLARGAEGSSHPKAGRHADGGRSTRRPDLAQRAANARKLASPDAAARLADVVEKLAGAA